MKDRSRFILALLNKKRNSLFQVGADQDFQQSSVPTKKLSAGCGFQKIEQSIFDDYRGLETTLRTLTVFTVVTVTTVVLPTSTTTGTTIATATSLLVLW